MPVIHRREAPIAERWLPGEHKDWFQQNSTVLYIIVSAVLTILSTIVFFLVWRIVLRRKLRALGLCVPRSRRPKVPITAEADHSDPYDTPYADIEGGEEIDDEERWRRQAIRIEWGSPAYRRSSFFLGKPAWDAEGHDQLLFDREKEAAYRYVDTARKVGGRQRDTALVDSYYLTPQSPVSQFQASMPKIAQVDSWYGQSIRSKDAPSALDCAHDRSSQYTTAHKNIVDPASFLRDKPNRVPHYHPYPLFALTTEPVIVVVPKADLPTSKPLYLPCPNSSSGMSSTDNPTTHRLPIPYPISTTPINHRPPPRSPPSIPCEPTANSCSDLALPPSPWRSLRDSFRPNTPRTDGMEEEYDHYQLPVIRPGSAFVPFPPTFTNLLDKDHRDRVRDRMSRLSSASGKPNRSSRMYEQMWEDRSGDEGGRRDAVYRTETARMSSIYAPPSTPSMRGRGGRASFAGSKVSRRHMPSPLRRINEI